MHLNKPDLQKQTLRCEFELLANNDNALLITSNPNISNNLSELNLSQDTVLLLKRTSDSASNLQILDENNIESSDLGTFQFIILDDVLEYTVNPKLFLTQISKFLEKDGNIICSVSNFTNIANRIAIFDGDFNNSSLDLEGKLNYFSLDNILLLLSETNFSITHLTRITNDDDSNQTTKNYVIPTETFDSITNDFESSTLRFVFSIKSGSVIESSMRKWLLEFPKYKVTEKMHSILEDIRQNYNKKIDYHIQSNREQYAIIKHLEQGIKEKDTYSEQIIKDKDAYAEQGISETTVHYEKIIEKIIKDKDAYAEQIIKDKDAYAEQIIKQKDTYAEQIIKQKDTYTEQIIKDKDTQLEELQNSTAFKFLRLLDKITNKNNS